MDRNFQRKTSLLIVLIVAVVAMTVAFAALSTQLKISGTASVPSTRWNIHFQNWALDTASTVTVGGVTHQNTAVYQQVNELTQLVSVANSTKVEGINVGLKQPGDYVKYTFQIINEGTIDASLDNFTYDMTCTSGNNCNHIAYTIECKDANDNNALVGNPTLAKNGGLVYCTLEVKYEDQTNNNTVGQNQVYEQSAASVTLEAEWTYIQKVNDNSGSGSGSGNEQQGGSSSGEQGGNEQGGGDSGSGSGQTENMTYYYPTSSGQQSTTSFDNSWRVWGQEQNGTPQACGKLPGGTVCFESGMWDCDEQSGGHCVNSTYVEGKRLELESKGAECEQSPYTLDCYYYDESADTQIGFTYGNVESGNFGGIADESYSPWSRKECTAMGNEVTCTYKN